MRPMTPQRLAEASKMVSAEERDQIVVLAAEVERMINSRLRLGLSGWRIGVIAASVRTELRDQIDAAIYHQRSTEHPGMPPI
jgi:hypothetical protein